MTFTTMVHLTDNELVLLDGQCRNKIQVDVDKAKKRLENVLPEVPEKFKDFVARVLTELENEGRLVHRYERIRHCDVCDKRAGYATYKRTSQYHQKGEKNYNKPLSFPAIELAHRFIRITGSVSVGCCSDCFKEILPTLKEILKDKKGEIPETLTGISPRWKRVDRRKCKNCGWEGNEAEMDELPALIKGKYPGQCPQCGARSVPFGPIMFDTLPGYDLVEIKEEPND